MQFHRFYRFDDRIGIAAFWGTLGFFSIGTDVMRRLVEDNTNGVIAFFAAFWLLTVWAGTLAAAVKRLHDRDKSGAWLLMILIPLFGWIWLVVELGFRRGTPGPNRYGMPDAGSPFEPRHHRAMAGA